ncbi:hypothetical protein G3I20_21135 [Streptomyces sp. SID8111]|uniref:hypothetical protein n=1 Tax=Streptomyces sp. SID8111 TaxID=2706100 RepID=UPI0013C02296|nr:hypothetical protein [Streptomyces sp. SID8111]NEC29015.1 hypothetical protein [Streptomyces sp. SID8111]
MNSLGARTPHPRALPERDTTSHAQHPSRALGLQGYSTLDDVYWNQIMAASLVVSVLAVAGFLLLQRYLVAGLTSGSGQVSTPP